MGQKRRWSVPLGIQKCNSSNQSVSPVGLWNSIGGHLSHPGGGRLNPTKQMIRTWKTFQLSTLQTEHA
jgi:hypothetical protein